MVKEKVRHSNTQRPYVMRKIVDVEEPIKYGLFVSLECGHRTFLYNSPSTSLKLFLISIEKESKTGCFECGKSLEVKR